MPDNERLSEKEFYNLTPVELEIRKAYLRGYAAGLAAGEAKVAEAKQQTANEILLNLSSISVLLYGRIAFQVS